MRLVILDADGVPDPSAIGTSGSRRLYGLPPPVCVTLSKHILIVSRPLEGIVWDAVRKINQTRKALSAQSCRAPPILEKRNPARRGMRPGIPATHFSIGVCSLLGSSTCLALMSLFHALNTVSGFHGPHENAMTHAIGSYLSRSDGRR